NFAINFVYRVAALSAAEKRDYEELFRRCQQLVEEFFLINSLPTSTAPPPTLTTHRPENRSTPASPLPRPLRFRFCVSAVSCSEGANIRRVSTTWQHFVVTT
ncbi:hypothetical protein, partial [Ralstonia solanacearum]|uniref:hypothetical protein n=1 Tax=Ralstonia solanacearum TaxID=305 RepID=UPI001E34F42F